MKFATANKVATAIMTLIGLFPVSEIIEPAITNFTLSKQSDRAVRNLDYSADAIERML